LVTVSSNLPNIRPFYPDISLAKVNVPSFYPDVSLTKVSVSPARMNVRTFLIAAIVFM